MADRKKGEVSGYWAGAYLKNSANIVHNPNLGDIPEDTKVVYDTSGTDAVFNFEALKPFARPAYAFV